MNLKRSLFVVMLLIFSLAVIGCSSQGSNTKVNEASEGPTQGEETSQEVDFPTKPITIIVHTSSGGPTDLMARETALALGEVLNQTVVVENRPGGSGATAMTEVFSAEPDGYTIGAMTPSQIGLINGVLKDQYGIDDFTWISRAQIDPYIIVVHSESPFHTLEDLVNYLKENPGGLSVGGYGAVGSGHNVAWNIFAEAAGIEATWTPFESTGDAVTALLGKHIDVANSNPGQVMEYVKAGQLRILGVMAEERLEDLPDVPTYAEAGYPVDTSWAQFRGFFGPKDIPEEVVQKLSDALLEAYNTESFREYMKNAQMVEGSMGYQEFTEYIHKQDALTKEWYERLGVN